MVRLNDKQLKQLAEFSSNLSILFFGSSIGPIFYPLEKVDPFMVILGLVLTVGCIVESMLLLMGKGRGKLWN